MNFALLILIINLLFFVCVAFYYSSLKKQMKEDAQKDLDERKMHGEEMARAEQKLRYELEDVHKKANMILKESEKVAQDLISELEKTLGRESGKPEASDPEKNNFEIELGNLSAKIKTQYVTRIHSLLRTFERFQIQEAHKVEEFAEEQAIATGENMQKLRVEELRKMHDRVQRYKDEEVSLFDKKVVEVIDAAAMEVLGHTLTNQEQGELIEKALEKAKAANKI